MSFLHEQPFFTEGYEGQAFEASITEAKNGGDEVGGGEDLEVALGGVVPFGAVDDGFGGGVPSDFLEGLMSLASWRAWRNR